MEWKNAQFIGRRWYIKERQGKKGWTWGLKPDSGHLARELGVMRGVCE